MRRAPGLICIPLLLAALVLPGAADAKPRLAGVFDLSGTPGQITRGPDGNIWVLISGSGDNNTLAKIRPNGNVTEYSPGDLIGPEGIVSGPDGNLWATRNGGVVRIPPGDPDSAQAFDIDAIGDPRKIIRAPGGTLVTASDDQLVSFPAADPNDFDATTIDDMSARAVTKSGGNIWIADFHGGEGRIVRLNASSGATKFFNVGGGPQGIARGPKQSVAYTNPGTDPQTVGRIEKGKNPKKTNVPNTDPFGITFAPDRKWWIANFASHNLTILNTEGKARRFRKLPDNSGPRELTTGPDKTLWVSLETSEQVARIKGVKR